jgi:hypothetical protein
MGWAARAKVRQGNPTHVAPRTTAISASRVERAFDMGARQVRVPFSDRAYVMDRHGVLRRIQATR